MNFVLHIFRKDTRHLFPEILITLAFTAAFAWAAPVQWFSSVGEVGGRFPSLLAPLLRILLPIAWLVLISRLIHDESLVGDRQFWITRPYTWPTLLASKLLFLAVFLYLPFFLMQIYLLHHAGLDVANALPDLLRYHLRLTAIFFLPFVVIAAVTSTFARLALSLLVAVLYLVGVFALGTQILGRRMMPPHVEALCAILFSAVLAATLLLQYATRRTRAARISLIGLPLVLLLVVLLAPAKTLINHTYTALPPASTPTLALDPDLVRQEPGSGPPQRFDENVLLSLPAQQTGMPPGLRFKAKGIAVNIDTAQGFHWTSPFLQTGTDLSATSKDPVVAFLLPASVFDRIHDTPVDLHLQIAGLIYETEAPVTIAASLPTFAAPGRGLCPLYPEGVTANCRYALRLPTVIDFSADVSNHLCGIDPAPASPPNSGGRLVAKHFIGSDDNNLAFDFDPVATTPFQLAVAESTPDHFEPAYLCPGAPVTFTPHQLTRHGQLSFSIRNLILAPYAKHQRSATIRPDGQR